MAITRHSKVYNGSGKRLGKSSIELKRLGDGKSQSGSIGPFGGENKHLADMIIQLRSLAVNPIRESKSLQLKKRILVIRKQLVKDIPWRKRKLVHCVRETSTVCKKLQKFVSSSQPLLRAQNLEESNDQILLEMARGFSTEGDLNCSCPPDDSIRATAADERSKQRNQNLRRTSGVVRVSKKVPMKRIARGLSFQGDLERNGQEDESVSSLDQHSKQICRSLQTTGITLRLNREVPLKQIARGLSSHGDPYLNHEPCDSVSGILKALRLKEPVQPTSLGSPVEFTDNVWKKQVAFSPTVQMFEDNGPVVLKRDDPVNNSKSFNVKTPKHPEIRRRSLRLANFIGNYLQRKEFDNEPEQPETPKKQIPVGDRFQANIPEWTGSAKNSDSNSDTLKFLGERVWPIGTTSKAYDMALIGRGKANLCSCYFRGTRKCAQKHTAEKSSQLRSELGSTFHLWGFNQMGETVSRSWKKKDQEEFHKLVKRHSDNFLKNAMKRLAHKSRTDIVTYYFNVFLPRNSGKED